MSAAATESDGQDGLVRIGRWSIRYKGARHGLDNALFSGVEDALRALAASRPDVAVARARPLAASSLEPLRFLAARTFAAAGTAAADEAIDWLLSDDSNLTLGWSDSRRWATREVIAAATRQCGAGHLSRLTRHLLNFYPPRELEAETIRYLRGRAQYDLLSAVDPARRDADVARRLGELERKFSEAPPSPPTPVAAGFVGSPVPQKAAEAMSDEQWLRAIQKHSRKETDWSGGRPVGGAYELAQSLGERAKKEPERFARLALRFPEGTPPPHFTRVIEAVAGQVPLPLLSELCVHADAIVGVEVRRSITYAIDNAGEVDAALVALLTECARDTDPDRELARTQASSGDYFYGGDFLSAGLNSTRGSAASAIARVLFRDGSYVDAVADAVADLATDPILGVRAQAADAVRALMNHRLDTALDLAAALMNGLNADLFGTPTVSTLLLAAYLRAPARFAPHLVRALAASDDAAAEQAGQVWAVAALRDAFDPSVPEDVMQLTPSARRGAAEVFAEHPIAVLVHLQQLFNDADKEVRANASHALRRLRHVPPHDAERLLTAFLGTAASAEHHEEALRALDERALLLPTSTIIACEHVIDAGGKALADISSAQALVADHVVSVLLRLYRQSDEQIRLRCLDAIDNLVELNAYGLDGKLDVR